MQRHRHQEFIRFLNAVEAEIAVGKIVHLPPPGCQPRKSATTLRAYSSAFPRRKQFKVNSGYRMRAMPR
jgi:hypothetical protein